MLITDRVTLDAKKRTGDGYLVADVKVGRTGIQTYTGSEMGRPDLSVVRVFRPEEEVFDESAMASAAHRPVTIDHPSVAVDASNWKRLAAGQTGGKIARDGDFLRVDMTMMDAAAIAQVEAGKRELSLGYVCTIDWTSGTTQDGQTYDAIQRGIKINHLAVVDAARAGSTCRIGDSWADLHATIQEDRNMPDNTRTVVVDGLSVLATDQSAQAIDKLLKDRADAHAAKDKLVSDHAAAIAAKDADLAKKDAEIDALNAKVLDDAALDARAQARGDLVAKAKSLVPTIDTAGKSDADIRRAVVVAKVGDAALKDKSAAYVDARFDILAEDVKPTDAFRNAVADGLQTTVGDMRAEAEKARAERDKQLRDGWRSDPKAA